MFPICLLPVKVSLDPPESTLFQIALSRPLFRSRGNPSRIVLQAKSESPGYEQSAQDQHQLLCIVATDMRASVFAADNCQFASAIDTWSNDESALFKGSSVDCSAIFQWTMRFREPRIGHGAVHKPHKGISGLTIAHG